MLKINKIRQDIRDLEKELEEKNKEYDKIRDDYFIEILNRASGKDYANIQMQDSKCVVNIYTDINSYKADCDYDIGNYFFNLDEAKMFARQINADFLIHKCHDIVYPDFQVPAYNELYYTILYDYIEQKYTTISFNFKGILYGIPFRTIDIAKRVCNLVNFEYNNKEGEEEE